MTGQAKSLLSKLMLILTALVTVTTGLVGIATPAQAATGNILPPFAIGETWKIYQGYGPDAYSHHNNQTYPSLYGLDLTHGGTNSSSTGKAIYAPVSGVIYGNPSTSGTGTMCINMADGRSVALTHINSSFTGGSVTAGQFVGTVAAVGDKGNGGVVAHLHLQMWSGHGCWATGNGGMPFDSAHNAQICGASDLVANGPSGSNGIWSGTHITGQSCSAPVVDSDGDGVADGSDTCPTEFGPVSLNGCPDGDHDGVANVDDKCPNFAGKPSNRGCRLDSHTVSGNFSGNDSYTDTLTFYDYTSNNLGAFVSNGGTNGVGQPHLLWTTGAGQWNWGTSSFHAGNFSGNDSHTDVIGLYDYGNGRLGAFLFQGNGNGVGQAQHLWTTADNTWAWGKARYVVGNFSNNDGKDDIAAFYGYADNSTGVFVLPGNGSGVNQPTHQWSTGPQTWNAQNAEYVAGNFSGNDSYTDVVAYYQYQGNDMGVFVFQGGNGSLSQPQHLWNSGQGTWNIQNAQFFAGDFAGGDDVTDVMALYDLGSANMGGYIMPGNGSGVNRVQNIWTTGVGQWYLNNAKIVTGKFAGSQTSLFGWYNYGNTTGGALFAPASPAAGVIQPQIKWTTAPGHWGWPSM